MIHHPALIYSAMHLQELKDNMRAVRETLSVAVNHAAGQFYNKSLTNRKTNETDNPKCKSPHSRP